MLVAELEQKARAAAARWARWRLGPVGFSDLITRVDTERLRYGRLITRYAVRNGTWSEEPFRGGTTNSFNSNQPMSFVSLDFWSGTPDELAARTSHTVNCGRCSGAGQVTCGSCAGTLRADCGGCGGSGRRMSRARKSYKMVNCSECRGNGKKRCTRCTKGLVGCSPCLNSGRMRRWLRLETVEHTHVAIWPGDERLRAHPGLLQGAPSALEWRGAKILEKQSSPGPIPASMLGPEAEGSGFPSVRRSLEPEIVPLRAKVLSQSVEVFEAPAATVHYTFAGKSGFLNLLGSDPRPTSARDSRPFLYRFLWLTSVFFLAWFAAIYVAGAFLGRDAFYQQHPSAGLAVLASLGLVPGLWLATASWVRRRSKGGTRPVPRWHDKLGLGLGGLCGLVVLGCFLFVRPSAKELARLTSTGDLAEAELHAHALHFAGDTSPDFVVARNDFIQARIQGVENRAAVELLNYYAEGKAGTQLLEEARRRLRVEWCRSALARKDEAEVERELSLLANEGAPSELVDGLRAELESQRWAEGKALLAKGAVDEAIQVLLRIQSPGLAPEPPGALLSRAYLLQARACPARALQCQVQALKRAVDAEPSDVAQTELAAFHSAEVVRLKKLARRSGAVGPALRALQEGEAEVGTLLAVLGEDVALKEARGDLRQRRDDLLRDRTLLGEPVEVAQALLGSTGLTERGPGVFDVREAPEGTLVHLFVAHGTARGAHVTARAHKQDALATGALQEVARRLTGKTFAEKDLKRSGKGVAHLFARLGSHPVLLGWQDDTLVEALIGKVDP